MATLKKRKLDIKLSEEDLDEFKKINVRMDNAERVLQTPNAPEALYTAGIKHREEVQFDLANWWDRMQKKYNVPGTARVDILNECFFEAVDEDGVASIADGIDPNTLDFINE